MRVLGEGRFWIAAHGDDPDLEPGDCGQDPEQFLRLATRAQGKHDVAIGDHAKIAMQSV